MGPIDITVTYILVFKRVNKTYTRSTWVTEIKPAEKNCLATIITEKLWLATKQKQIHDLPPKTGNQNSPAWWVIDKACNNILPTFIDNKKYLI